MAAGDGAEGSKAEVCLIPYITYIHDNALQSQE